MLKILSLLIVFSYSVSVSAQNDDILYYNKRATLTWEDFKKSAPTDIDTPKAFLAITLQMSQIKTNIWMGYGVYDAQAIVLRDASWVKEGTSSDLRHFQYAFTLTELVAKKLKEEINEAKIHVSLKKKVDKIFTKYDLFLKHCLDAYYKETENGENKTKQAEWEALIDRNQIKLEIPSDK